MFFYKMYIATALKDRSLSALVVGITASNINLPTSSLTEPHNSAPLHYLRACTHSLKLGRLLRPWCVDLECRQFCLSMLS